MVCCVKLKQYWFEAILQLIVFSWVKPESQGYKNLHYIKEMIQDKIEIHPGTHKSPSGKDGGEK